MPVIPPPATAIVAPSGRCRTAIARRDAAAGSAQRVRVLGRAGVEAVSDRAPDGQDDRIEGQLARALPAADADDGPVDVDLVRLSAHVGHPPPGEPAEVVGRDLLAGRGLVQAQPLDEDRTRIDERHPRAVAQNVPPPGSPRTSPRSRRR
jgi:hypothetical protein